jgi:hypothetical protein
MFTSHMSYSKNLPPEQHKLQKFKFFIIVISKFLTISSILSFEAHGMVPKVQSKIKPSSHSEI